MTPSGPLRKRPLNQANVRSHHLEQDRSFPQSRNKPQQNSSITPSKPNCEHSPSKPPMPRDLSPSLPLFAPKVSSVSTGCDGHDHPDHVNGPDRPSRSKQINRMSFEYKILVNIKACNDYSRRKSTRYEYMYIKTQQIVFQVRKWNTHAKKKSAFYQYIYNKTKHYLCRSLQLLRKILIEIISIRCTCKQTLLFLSIIIIGASSYLYIVKVPVWRNEEEWILWEVGMQQSVANLIPPVQPENYNTKTSVDLYSNSEHMEQFPYLKQQFNSLHHLDGKGGAVLSDHTGASEYVVPVPDYELIGKTREKLAQGLQEHAIQSCKKYKQDQYDTDRIHSLPVIGITVANDTPENRYLRRLLHTIDLKTVGSIVITWYDEQTEAQIIGMEKVGQSHKVTEQTLQEFISLKGFSEISWDGKFVENMTASDGFPTPINGLDESMHDKMTDEIPFPVHTQLADTTSLKLMSQITTSIRQFCLSEDNQSNGRKRSKSTNGTNSSRSACQNELLILRFSTNLGCSTGVNNPLFTHPNSPHWLIANYDIAYPPGVLNAMGKELQKTKMQKPDLAVHTYGYIYGRGKLENPWSNFIMTNCAVANVGIWDENLFPAYYEDDDYRDRIRYIMGKWIGVVGDPDRYGNVPQYLMDDEQLIHYQTDRHVSVAHGPLNANTYLSGTHETMKRVAAEEEKVVGILESIRLWIRGKPQNPLHYDNQRWNIIRTLSNTKGFFQCKHGALPDSGEHGEDSVRYFGWNERFQLPFVNRTRVSRLRESMLQLDKTDVEASHIGHGTNNQSPWAVWHFNATRRNCVHKGANLILSMSPSEERTDLTEKFRALCGVC